MADKFILEGKKAVPADTKTWARWYETANRRVANEERDGVRVSTVFLGLDHSFGDGAPQIFETLVFGGEHDQDMDRCSTWEEAEAMHARMCEKVWGK